jgi:damage-control phosphatase, subfamily III
MVARWQGYIADGTFALAVKPDTPYGPPANVEESEDSEKRAGFWSLPWPGWSLKAYAPTLFEEFCQSGLVIFKVRQLAAIAAY